MKSPKTKRHDNYKATLKKLLAENPEARKIAQKYRVLAYTLNKGYPKFMATRDSWTGFLQDVVYIDRMLRKYNEGNDQENKDVTEQTWQIENGYEPGANVKIDV